MLFSLYENDPMPLHAHLRRDDASRVSNRPDAAGGHHSAAGVAVARTRSTMNKRVCPRGVVDRYRNCRPSSERDGWEAPPGGALKISSPRFHSPVAASRSDIQIDGSFPE